MPTNGSYRDHTATCSGEEVDVFLTNDEAMREIKLLKEANGGQNGHLRPSFCQNCNGYHLQSTDPKTTGKALRIPKKPQVDRQQNNRRDWSGFNKRRKG